ncbi:MAG: 30S ribosomal protein S18 [Candidatus Paceibacterota bacterium]
MNSNINLRSLDYKHTDILKKFLDDHGRILPRAKTGVTAKNQRRVANAIKQARFMGLLPYILR